MSNKQILDKINLLKQSIHDVFVGKEKEVEYLLIGFFSGLHVLLEDIPGVGKTTLAKTLAKSTQLKFARIQFTPDLLPQDILGMTIWSLEKHDFIFKPGSMMNQFILADEINRASARTQSSFLEAMQEAQLTVEGKTFALPQPFFVIATQNPTTFTGTFKLPEAQIDRFGLSFSIGYPSEPEELKILDRFKETNPLDNIKPVIKPEEIIQVKQAIHKVMIKENVKSYLVRIAKATRNDENIKLGMSPRASQHLLLASQAHAFMAGREYVVPEDILETAEIVIPHRLILSPEAKMANKNPKRILKSVISQISVPTGL